MLAFHNVSASGLDDVARAASRATAQNTANGGQLRTVTTSTSKSANSTSARGTGTRDTRASAGNNGEARTTSTKNVAARTSTVAPRTTTQSRPGVVSRTGVPGVTARRTVPQQTKLPTQSTTRTTNRSRNATSRTTHNVARVATDASGALIANYAGCRQIYYECMDEFCATKDANLRRCACSSRVNEFNSIKKQLSNVEDKMLDFNQRLLLVNLDAEDAAVINTATEGEDAFYATKDRTKSKRALDEIADKLNAKFGDDSSSGSLAPVSLSLNIDSAFDTVDSFMGSDTTSKSGPALYNAAIPVCREIATEVCTEDELSLAISGYQMLMEQDCNTVYKSYQTQVDAARTKVFESSALLDMSRLDAYQTRNSDDMLTCKRKMLDMLTDQSVCGKNLQNCLDMTGKYIDPTTGSAFLTVNLADLADLIIRPGVNQTWTSANGSSPFLTYLRGKKNYLASAMENCQDIADSVWDAFIEDALAQIKLAQISKLEEVRQACTTLTTECLTSAAETIEGFDARALSIFGVSADRTVNSICASVQTACAKLIDMDLETQNESITWETGMTDIATQKTYDSIISSCTQVGRNCIIQACKSISGNFDLCDDIDFSANRHAILERTSCWPELNECVGAAGDDALIKIIELLNKPQSGINKYAFYDEMYNTRNPNPIWNMCTCDDTVSDAECAKCRIAERIWGNCEQTPQNKGTNRILIPTSPQSTLLAWFAINTGTATVNGTTVIADSRSCVNTRCSSGEYATGANGAAICMPLNYSPSDMTSDGMYCPTNTNPSNIQMSVPGGITNCCYAQSNSWGHIPMSNNGPCCETGRTEAIDNDAFYVCLPQNTNLDPVMKNGTHYIVCVGGTVNTSGDSITCTGGRFVLINKDSHTYSTPTSQTIDANTPHHVYYNSGNNTHSLPQDTTSGGFIRYGN